MILTRRETLISASASLVLPAAAKATVSESVWRGSGQNMRQTIQGYGGGGNWSCCTRSRHYSNTAFRYARFVIALFDNLAVKPGGVVADRNFSNNMHFQIGLEYPYADSYAGISPRRPVTFNGSSVLSYNKDTGPFGYAVSDVIDFGQTIPPGTWFGLWTTNENAEQNNSGFNTLPYQASGMENYQSTATRSFQRFQGTIAARSSLISSDAALTASAVKPYGSTQSTADASIFTPCMMLIDVDSDARHYYGIGDSICYGVGEGAAGSGIYGDALGSPQGNAGYLARWVFESLGQNLVNLGRGSDGYKYFSPVNWKYRLGLLGLANPTHVIMQNSHNDIAGGYTAAQIYSLASPCYAAVRATVPTGKIIAACCTPNSGAVSSPAWRPSTNYKAGNVIASAYICRTAGTSASSGRGPSGQGTSIVDGTARWSYIFAGTADAQIPTPGWGNSSSNRGVWNNQYIRSSVSSLNNDYWIDPNPQVEFQYREYNTASETSLWNFPNRVAFDLTEDGTHPNSYGNALMAANLSVHGG